MGLNNVTISGYITDDIELRQTLTTGKSVTNFTVAVNNYHQENPDWIDCEVWGNLAETIAQYCGKGSRVEIVGRLKTSQYENQDGRKIKQTRVVVEKIEFLGSSQNRLQNMQYQNNQGQNMQYGYQQPPQNYQGNQGQNMQSYNPNYQNVQNSQNNQQNRGVRGYGQPNNARQSNQGYQNYQNQQFQQPQQNMQNLNSYNNMELEDDIQF